MRNKILLYIIALVLPIIILLTMTFLPLMTFFFGEEILLETQPVDPWDPFRGEYVNLSFKINDVPVELLPAELQNKSTFHENKDRDLYAVLKKDGDYFSVDYMSFTRPNHQYYLEADIQTSYLYTDTVFVDYPIDRFFVPQGEGKYLEDLSRKGQLVAKVKVWKGYPLLIDVYPKES